MSSTTALRALLVVLAVTGALVAAGCPSGYRLERVEGVAVSVRAGTINDPKKIASAVAAACPRKAAPYVHCAKHAFADICRPIFDHRGDKMPKMPVLTSRLSFLHFSDAQLKEHNIHLDGPLGEAFYDGLVSGSSRNPMLERHDDAAYLATILAGDLFRPPNPTPARAASEEATSCDLSPESPDTWTPDALPLFLNPPPSAPLFGIHTGDAVDSGMYSELIQFLAISQQLRVPFYNVIGNHDGLFFGTFPPELMGGLNVVIPYVPIMDIDRFMRFHSSRSAEIDLSLPRPTELPGSLATRRGEFNGGGTDPVPLGLPETDYAGFDLVCPTPFKPLCNEARGYYAFDLPEVPGTKRPLRVRAVVLNTSEVGPASVKEGVESRALGNVLPEQLRWLEGELDDPKHADRYFLVFAHHNFTTFLHDEQTARLRQMFLERPRVIGFITGHNHRDAYRLHPRPSAPDLVEVIGGSTLVYPQFARVVDLLQDGEGALYLRVLTFRQALGDYDDTFAGKTGDCRVCGDLATRAALARQGASLDENDADRTEDREAIGKGNLLRLVATPPKAP